MPKQEKCSAIDSGRIKNFDSVSLLADYLEVSDETAQRWRRKLVREKKPLVWSYEGIFIDFNPDNYTNKNLNSKSK